MKRYIILGIISAAIILFGAATYASADTTTVVGTGTTTKTATDTVSVKVFANTKLTMTVTTPAAAQTVDFGNVDPGAAYGPQAVGITIQSNKPYNLSKVTVGAGALGLATSLADSANNARTSGQLFTDNYSINVPWTTDPGAYTATVQYTVVQN